MQCSNLCREPALIAVQRGICVLWLTTAAIGVDILTNAVPSSTILKMMELMSLRFATGSAGLLERDTGRRKEVFVKNMLSGSMIETCS